MKRLNRSLLNLIVATFVLQACRSQPEPIPSPVLAGHEPQPTVVGPTDGTPTAVISDQIDFADYTHSSRRFELNYPRSWDSAERSDGVVMIEPANQASFSVFFRDVGQSYSQQELNQYLVTFVAENFVNNGSDFKPISQDSLPDGTVVARFSSIDPAVGQTESELRVMQQDTIVYVIHLNATEAHWPVATRQLQALADTVSPLDTKPEGAVQATPQPPAWSLIGPESKEFGFLAADDWEIVEQDRNLVAVALPNLNMIFTASSFSWPAADKPDSAQQAALAHIEELTGEFADVQSLAPADFPLDTAQGATIDFLFVTAEGTNMAGSVITAANDGKMYKLVFTAPAEVYDAALQWFNPMHKSFKFLSPDDFVIDGP